MMRGEKLTDRGIVETHAPSAAQTLLETLSFPFEPLHLRRPMKLFPTALGLRAGCPGLPSDEFLANFLSGQRSYLAILRHGFGKDFKNFQNYALQRVETTTAVRNRLVEAAGGDEQVLEILAQCTRAGTVASALAQLTRVAEGAAFQVITAMLSGSLKCPHCKQELISRPAQWWSEQLCLLGPAEYRVIDRILYDVLAITLLPLVMRPNWGPKLVSVAQLANLCEPGAHPFRRWLDLVRKAYRAKDLTALSARARLENTQPETLQRCSRGEMLTVETIRELTGALADPHPLRDLGMRSRVLAFAVDFLGATDDRPEPLTWDAAQDVIQARLLQLGQDLRLNFAKRVRPSIVGKKLAL